jgi:hypothetical protein
VRKVQGLLTALIGFLLILSATSLPLANAVANGAPNNLNGTTNNLYTALQSYYSLNGCASSSTLTVCTTHSGPNTALVTFSAGGVTKTISLVNRGNYIVASGDQQSVRIDSGSTPWSVTLWYGYTVSYYKGSDSDSTGVGCFQTFSSQSSTAGGPIFLSWSAPSTIWLSCLIPASFSSGTWSLSDAHGQQSSGSASSSGSVAWTEPWTYQQDTIYASVTLNWFFDIEIH